MEVQRLGAKFFARDGRDVELTEFIPLFHRWIQTQAVPGLLIDVADYAHVHHGPGIVLIGHEGDYATDLTGGRMGLLYTRKRLFEGDLEARLQMVCRLALLGCRALEEAPELGGRLSFPCDEMVLIFSDRLRAPNTSETERAVEPVVSRLVDRLWPGRVVTRRRPEDPRERFALHLKADEAPGPAGLLERLQ